MSRASEVKKLDSVLAIFTSMIVASIETVLAVVLSLKALILVNFSPPLKRVLCIYYLMQFKKDQAKTLALINSSSKINTITPAYMARQSFKIQRTDVKAQKIDGPYLAIYK